MLTYALENRGTDTLYEYLYKQIKTDILSKKLVAGERLPSKRLLAKNLNVSTITVENAYSQLVAEGYIFDSEKRLLCYGHFGRSDEAVAGATGEAI